jgi:phage terminase Nu1 subunit (DNA packaging protein)
MPSGTRADPQINSGMVALMLGISDVQVSNLKKEVDNPIPLVGKRGREFLFDIHAVHNWDVKRQIRNHYRGTRTTDDDTGKVVDFNTEKTRLTKAQADSKELENQDRLGKLAEIDVLKETLSTTLNSVAAILDSIPAEMRRQCPHLSQADIDEIATVIAKVRNSIDGAELPLPHSA